MIMTTRFMDVNVMREMTVSGRSTLAETYSSVLTINPNITFINSNVFTLDSVEGIAVSASIVGDITLSTATVTGVDSANKQITLSNIVGSFSSSESITVSTPFVSTDPDSFITVGGLQTLPDLFGEQGSTFAQGLKGKADWKFFDFDGFVEYGTGVSVPTRKTVIRYVDGGNTYYYKLNTNAGLPYTITGVIATDLVYFVELQGSTAVTSQETGEITSAASQQLFQFSGVTFDDNNNNHIVIVDDKIIPVDAYTTVPPDMISFAVGRSSGEKVRVRIMAPLQSVIVGAKGDPGVAGAGQRFSWEITSTDNFAVLNQGAYFVDTTGGSLSAILPVSPVADDTFAIADYLGTWGNSPVTLNRNGNKIMGLDEDMQLSISWAKYIFTYVDATVGWRLTV